MLVVFIEHECSEAIPGVIPYLISSQHEDEDCGDEETVGGDEDIEDGYYDMVDDEGDDGEPNREANDEGDDVERNGEADDGKSNGETDAEGDDDIERPREDDEPEQSEDETPAVEENQNENQEVGEDANHNGDDDGDDVVIDAGDGATDDRFSSLFKEGEQCRKCWLKMVKRRHKEQEKQKKVIKTTEDI